MSNRENKILRVGFDLDGVLLYNPARIFRPIIVLFKKIFLPKERNKFHLPKTRLQKLIWLFLHKSSFIFAPGLDEIKKLVKVKKIRSYIISARYDFLKNDFNRWIKKLEAKNYFEGCYHNNNDEQPHYYKHRMIESLKLDIFIEDNWDIVDYLNKKSKAKIFWIYNILDRKIAYHSKFPTLAGALKEIKKRLET